jgi:hypothetical protein
MMRNYSHIDEYLDDLKNDIYSQPSDPGHTAWATNAIERFILPIKEEISFVLDVGCGDGFCRSIFEDHGMNWTCITLGEEEVGESIIQNDMSFIDCPDDYYELVFARHVLEHSPMPLLTLMEWKRVSNKCALIILPAPEYWKYGGRNHYSMLEKKQWEFLFERAGWNIIKEHELKTTDSIFLDYWMEGAIKREDRVWKDEMEVVEYQFLLEKKYE